MLEVIINTSNKVILSSVFYTRFAAKLYELLKLLKGWYGQMKTDENICMQILSFQHSLKLLFIGDY